MSAGRFTTRWGRRRGSATEAELISRLRELPGPVPEARFKSELRAQLVAITARIVSESAADSTEEMPATAARSRTAGGRALRRLRRPLLALAGAATVLVLLLGMAVWMAGGSLPGESLYGVKRASENVQLSIAGNDTAKGQAYLQLARNRMREVAELLSQTSAMPATGRVSADGRQVSPHTASLISDTLASADDDTVNAMQLLGRAAVAQRSAEPLTKMSDWLPRQRGRATAVRDRIPAGELHTRVQASVLLLERIAARTVQLNSAMGCSCLAGALADELGPVPCTPCAPVPTPTSAGSGGGGATLPVPIPGLGSTGMPGSVPNPSLPPSGGGPGSSGYASGSATSPSSGRPGMPGLPVLPGLPVTTPAPQGSSGPISSTPTPGWPLPSGPISPGSTSGAGTVKPPIVVGGSSTIPVPVPLPSVPSVPGRTTPTVIPTSLPVPLPSVSFP